MVGGLVVVGFVVVVAVSGVAGGVIVVEVGGVAVAVPVIFWMIAVGVVFEQNRVI